MGLDPKESNGNFVTRALPKEGKHIIRNYGMVDLGTQMVAYQNNPPKPTHMVALLFELPKILQSIKEGEAATPFTISQEYSFVASDRSKLCQVLKSWGKLKTVPKTLNLKPYLGQYCEANIVHKPKASDPSTIYANIDDGGRDIYPLTKEIENPAEPGTMIKFVGPDDKTPLGCQSYSKDVWFELDKFNWDQFYSLPKFIQNKIKKSVEWPVVLAAHPEPQSAGTAYANSSESMPMESSSVVTSVDNSAPAF
jgi:hypothetical protein